MRITIPRGVFATLIGFCLIWSLSSCAGSKEAEKGAGEKGQMPSPAEQAAPTPPPPKEPTYFIRTVTWPNESISIIAAWYTGQMDNWKILVEANPELDPTRIRIGDKVRIPEELLKTREPMPQTFVESLVPKPKPAKKAAPSEPQKPPPATSPPPAPEPDIKLYGPKS
ncbi:MAG TPA: hypothetical protein VMU60_01880 [Syntrophobacteria bacterium]|nr:hypothetical protein [Syntrophobacteria bacterium]